MSSKSQVRLQWSLATYMNEEWSKWNVKITIIAVDINKISLVFFKSTGFQGLQESCMSTTKKQILQKFECILNSAFQRNKYYLNDSVDTILIVALLFWYYLT